MSLQSDCEVFSFLSVSELAALGLPSLPSGMGLGLGSRAVRWDWGGTGTGVPAALVGLQSLGTAVHPEMQALGRASHLLS